MTFYSDKDVISRIISNPFALDTSSDYFTLLYYVLKTFKVPKTDSESALVAFVLKSLNAHAAVLLKFQFKSKTAQIVPQKLLKLIQKVIKTIDFTQSARINSRKAYFEKMREDIVQDLYKLVEVHTEIPTDRTLAYLLSREAETS